MTTFSDRVRIAAKRRTRIPSGNFNQSTKPKKSIGAKEQQTELYKERRELEAAPLKIEELEQEQSELHAKMADPEFFKKIVR